MSIKDWRVGQFVVALIAHALVAWIGLVIGVAQVDNYGGNETVGWALIIAACVSVVSAFVVAWRWFGGRRRT